MTRQAYKVWRRAGRGGGTPVSLDIKHDGDRANSAQSDRAMSVPSADTVVERQLDVMQVLRRLTDAHREVLVLREIQGLSYEEIAAVLGVPRGTVESRLFRARAEFRERYDPVR
jgi:RNA polymerase sigma-70 factor (ECF subfamily)